MRHRWLFVSAVVMLGSLASGCSEGKSPLGRLDMQTASSHELELKKLLVAVLWRLGFRGSDCCGTRFGSAGKQVVPS